MRKSTFLVLVSLLLISGLNLQNSVGNEINQVQNNDFDPLDLNLILLSPNTNPFRNEFASLIAEQFALFDSGAAHVSAGWDVVGPRTFAYDSGGVGIPTYENGGYDFFIVGLGTAYNHEPLPYLTSELSPVGLNFAFYQNPIMDNLINNYYTEFNESAKAEFASRIQEIMLDELPYIPIVGEKDTLAYSRDFVVDADATEMKLITTGNHIMDDLWNPASENIVYGHPFFISEWSPFVSVSEINSKYLTPMFPGLYEQNNLDTNFGFRTILANGDPQIANGGKEITVDINPIANFSNGNPVTAWDVVNTYRAHLDPIIASTQVWLLNSLNQTMGFDAIEWVDTDTVKFHFEEGSTLNLEALTLGILDDAALGNYTNLAGVNLNDKNTVASLMIGAGPYKYNTISEIQSTISISKVTNWWGGTVKTSTIEFRNMNYVDLVPDIQSGVIHIADEDSGLKPSEIIGYTNVAYVFDIMSNQQFLSINMQHPILGTGTATPLGIRDPTQASLAAKYVRKAISHLIPRQLIVDSIYEGNAVVPATMWPSTSNYYDDSFIAYEFSINKAKEYFEMAGYSFDNIPPTISSFSVQNIVEDSVYQFTAEITDVNSSISLVTFDFFQESPITVFADQLANGLWSVTLPYDAVGDDTTISYRIFANDTAGNAVQTTWATISLPSSGEDDTFSPIILNIIQDLKFEVHETVIIEVELQDDNPGTYDLILNGDFIETNNTWQNGPLTIEIDSLEIGNYTLELYVYDSFGNSAHVAIEFSVVEQEDGIQPAPELPNLLPFPKLHLVIIPLISISYFLNKRKGN